MNFYQKPGLYKVKDDSLLFDFDYLFKAKIFSANMSGTIKYLYKSSYTFDVISDFYVILPNDIECVMKDCFSHFDNLTGVSGKKVGLLLEAFNGCYGLNTIDFPNLNFLRANAFNNTRLEETHTNEEGLFIIDHFLVNAFDYKDSTLIIPQNIQKIATDAFAENYYLEDIVLPINLKNCPFTFNYNTSFVTLPINIKYFACEFGENTQFIYKGTKKQLQELFDKGILSKDIKVLCKPYKTIELENIIKEHDYSLKDTEAILGRKLKLDEMLSLNYSIKEANDYFKGIDR